MGNLGRNHVCVCVCVYEVLRTNIYTYAYTSYRKIIVCVMYDMPGMHYMYHNIIFYMICRSIMSYKSMHMINIYIKINV